MHKYRVNKAIEQITLIAGNIRSFFAPQRNYEGLGYCGNNNNSCKLIKKAKLMPDEMWDDTDKRFNNVFGYGVQLNSADKSKSGDKQAFYIDYDIPLDKEVCIELVTYDWGNAGVKGIGISGRIDENQGQGGTHKVPIDIDKAVAYCTGSSSFISFQLSFIFDVNDSCWHVTSPGNYRYRCE